jgi:hypothetical protein
MTAPCLDSNTISNSDGMQSQTESVSAQSKTGGVSAQSESKADSASKLSGRDTREHCSASKPGLSAAKSSVFFISCVAFLAINITLSFTEPYAFDPYKFLYRGWAWWTIDNLRRDKQPHNVALMGSSLMVSAVAGCDANFLNQSIDLTEYHKASYLDSLLVTKFGGEFNTYNLSAPGQMPSDAYLTLQAMVNTDHRPDVVVYGIAPRDFIDSFLSNPTDTEPFRYLKRIVNIDDVASGLYRSPIPHIDWLLQRNLYFYAYSLDLQMALRHNLRNLIAILVPQPPTTTPFTWYDRKKLLPTYLAGEYVPGCMVAGTLDKAAAKQQFVDNSAEYKERYKKPEPHIYQTQFYFLRKIASYCRREKIKLVLFNMPLTKLNIGLLKPEVHTNYLKAIENFGVDQGIAIFNACDTRVFGREDFHDSVHMNAFGGKKFFNRVVNTLASNPATCAVFKQAGEELSKRTSLASTGKGGVN